ncbi:MAG: AAA family ATPase [Candidatus Marinimicrobia bacterium]|nr:AAA family ATPase [Candidatus Neomarinimicrobiota bacterium]
MDLKLCRISIQNYKSIKSIDLTDLPNLVVFVGRNDAGKSNILDCINFLYQAERNLNEALQLRGGSFKHILRNRNVANEIKIEIVFEVIKEKRTYFIQHLFKKNHTLGPVNVLKSPFLKNITYSLQIDDKNFSEEILTEDVVNGDQSVCLIRAEGDADGGHSKFTSNLEEVCEVTMLGDPLEVSLDKTGSGSGSPSRILFNRLGQPTPPTIWYQLMDLVRVELINFLWISPIRKSISKVRIQSSDQLDSESANLVDVTHTINTRYPEKFREIEGEIRKLVPRIGMFLTPTTGGDATLGVQDNNLPPDEYYELDPISFGTRTAIAIITGVMHAKPGTWICIEEPETNLHPKAQAQLFNFLQFHAINKRIFVTTHSSVFASLAPADSVFLITRDKDDGTVAERIEESNVDDVILELGIRASYNFEADAIVFVEGPFDLPIYKIWTNRYGFNDDIQLIDSGSWNNMSYYANAKILQNRRIKVQVFVIFDGDTECTKKIRKLKNRLIAELKIPKDHILTLNQSEVEGYLLDSRAITDAFPEIHLSQEELDKRIGPYRGRRNQKAVLDELFREFGIGRYDGELGARIVQKMEKIPPQIEKFFSKIKSTVDG